MCPNRHVEDELLAFFKARTADQVEVVKSGGDLFAAGVLDSFGLLELAMFVEKEYRIALDFETLAEDDFRTLPAIAALVTRERSRQVPAPR